MKLSINNKTCKKVLYLVMAIAAMGQAYAQLELSKHTINNGGGVMNGGGYEVRGSIGQVDAGIPASAGNYTLNSGFWHENTDLIFKNKFQQ